jgi:hypothetical protein
MNRGRVNAIEKVVKMLVEVTSKGYDRDVNQPH